MPNYSQSNLVLAQTRLFGKFGKDAQKSINPVTYLAIKNVTEIMVPSHKAVRTREDRPINSFTFDYTQRALGTGRSHNHPGTSGDSLFIQPSFNTLSDPFTLTLKQMDNNIYSYDEVLANELTTSIKNFMTGLDDRAKDFLFANRSGINSTDYPIGTYNATSEVYEITEADIAPTTKSAPTLAQIVDSVMADNFLDGDQMVFCDPIAYDKFNQYYMQGAGNDINMSFQHENKMFIRSIGLNNATRFGSVGTYNKGVFCVVPVGSIGHLDWIPKQNRQGIDKKLQTYSMIQNPVDNLDYAFHFYPERVDGTSRNGFTQDEAEHYELSIDSSFVLAPLSSVSTAAGETVIQAFALV